MASKLKKLQMPSAEQDMLPEADEMGMDSESADEEDGDMPAADEEALPASPLADASDEELLAEIRARGLESKLSEESPAEDEMSAEDELEDEEELA